MFNPIRYFSTNHTTFGMPDLENKIRNGSLLAADLAEAIITGQAPDGGLFMPTHFPSIGSETRGQMRDMPYHKVFVETMKGFFEGVLPEKTLEGIAKEAYTFEPFIEKISDIDYIVRLDEGPTAAFKDYAAQVLFRLTEALMKEHNSSLSFTNKLKDMDLLTYVVATSGDTGSAMGVACHERGKMWMAVLHPADVPGRVSDLQAKQMDTLGGNIHVIRVTADFDACQLLASMLQKDTGLKYMNITSANSINIGRLLPQITYYFYAHSKIAKPDEEAYFSVPSGNFGNAVAGLFARRMGLPIKLIVAVNENDVFERFYKTRVYEPAPETKVCPSTAMDVNKPSNMRRLFQLYGGQLIGEREVKAMPDMERLKEEIAAYSISNKETYRLVEKFYKENHMIESLRSTIEPHGAVAWGAAQKFREERNYKGKIVTLETAHPGKFPESLEKFEIKPELPPCLARLVNVPNGSHYVSPNDYGSVKALLKSLYHKEVKKLS